MTIDLNAMLAKRREVLGEGNKFDVDFGGKKFWFVAPNLASEEWNARFNDLQDDLKADAISRQDFADEFLELLLDDQVEEFRKAAAKEGIDPSTMATWAVQEYAESVRENPTRSSSRNTPNRSKRR